MNTLETALHLHKTGQFEQAEILYRQLIEKDPTFTEAIHALAILLAMQQHYDEANELVHRAIALHPNNLAYLNTLGNIYLGKNNYGKAIQTYEQVLTLNSRYVPALNNLGKCHYQQKNYQKAHNVYQKAIELKPDNTDALFNLALTDIQLNDHLSALKHLKQSLDINANNSSAQYQLAQLYLQQQNYLLAETHLKHCLSIAPCHGNALHDLGLIFLFNQDYKKAIEKIIAAIDNDCLDSFAHYHLAIAYLENKDNTNALQHFLRQTQINKDFASYYNAAVILMHQNRHQDALMYFNIALKQQPNHLPIHVNIAGIYLKMQKLEAAISHYEKALTLNPLDQEIQHILNALKQTDTPDAAPTQYVQHLFDSYANYFDEHLTQHLAYATPEKIQKALEMEASADTDSQWCLLDLGCGTGLMGERVKPYCKELIGIDISEAMLAQAKQKNIYDQLIKADIHSALKTSTFTYDVVLAADVFTYIGNLEPIFQLIYQRMKHQGWFAFSVERSNKKGFELQTNIRYAHHKAYVVEIAERCGFKVIRCDNLILRKQYKQDVEGYLFIFYKEI
ncbi:MAG: hypothetical protein A3F17_00350 [Gammaproteobacteria bacterium RIFCSPHIGHO2_12_FULL_41_15]|nr:MAG: hypothetical protein A3F17_00350 [Gammaproteobacteria bacterium RIFCSPHIGHO2_12_FULL_41_15]